jgi:superfamily II DNA or RNA helicase
MPAGADRGALPITTFQTHGVNRAERIIEKYGGVLIADGVGLGKTFTAGEIIRKYREKRQRVLLVCPATLRDGSWKEFQDRFDLRFETVSYEELAVDRQLGGNKATLGADLNDYQLVVIDESHNYRNPDAPKRAGVLRQLLGGPVPKDVVLLSATPVNNSLWDLYHLLGYFLKSDGALADRGVPSLREPFDEAMRVEAHSLSPDVLWPVLDATTVKRTRQFVKKYYQNEQIKLPDGRTVPLTFPQPVPSTVKYNLNGVLPGFVAELEAALMPPGSIPRLTLARYQPDRYQRGAAATEGTVIGLLRSALLKRFESSAHAFGRTTAKMVREHEMFLSGLGDGIVYAGTVVREVSAADDEDADELLDELTERQGLGRSASEFDLARLRKDVENDLTLLRSFADRTAAVRDDYDPKLDALVDELATIAAEAERDGLDAEDKRRNRKVLIFSYFADTVDWIYAYLKKSAKDDPRLAAYHGRLAAVTGGDSESGMNREAAVAGFAPETSGRRGGQDRFDVLVTTDVLAEGLNLQMCRNIVNYDLPWNPMRLVQRHGRIDRIGSPHKRVFLRTVFPDEELDRLLELEYRVRSKLAQAAASVGVEASPIVDGAAADRAFTETRREIERIMAGDPAIYEAGGTA